MEALNGLNTYIGIAVAVAPSIAHLFGFSVTPQFNTDFGDTVAAVVTLLGTAFAVWGRLRASTPGWFAKDSVAAPQA